VTNRARFTRRQRSRSALGHLQSVQNERSIDDAVATAAAAGKLKLSNDELHTTSSPDLDKRKGFASLPKLRAEQKDAASKDGLPWSNSREQLMEQHAEHARQSPTLQRHVVSPGSDRGRPRNARPLIMGQPSQKTATNPLVTIARSYCGAAARPESVLLFPGHSRDILLRQSRDRVANASSGLLPARPDESDAVDGSAAKSAAAYLGSNADGHSPVMRRVVMRNRNRAANMLRCWQRPESNATAEQARLFDLAGDENRLSSSLLPGETGDVESGEPESSSDVSPSYLSAADPVPFLEFKKADYWHEMSPLSLSVQCGSDSDDFDGAHETLVAPTHRLTSKRVWNVKTRSWEDAVDQCCTESVCSNPEALDFSRVAFQSMSRDAGNIVFTKADTGVKSSMPVRAAKCHGNRCYFSENDIRTAQSHMRERYAACQHSVRHINAGASSKCSHTVKTRHSVIGGGCGEKVVSDLHQKAIQFFCRAKSCPEVTAFPSILPFHCVHTSINVRRRRTKSRYVRHTIPIGSERRKRSNGVVHRRQLAPPLFASWPGKGDIKGSMLAYESSV